MRGEKSLEKGVGLKVRVRSDWKGWGGAEWCWLQYGLATREGKTGDEPKL